MESQGVTYYFQVPWLKGAKCIKATVMNCLRIINDQKKMLVAMLWHMLVSIHSSS